MSDRPYGTEQDRKSPIVNWVYRTIKNLRSWTCSYQIKERWISEDKRDRFIEDWVIGFFLLSVILFAFLPVREAPTWEWFIIIVATLRILGAVIWILWAVLFHGFTIDDSEKTGPFSGPRRSIILTFINFAEFVFWFALIYRFLSLWIKEELLVDHINALTFSFINISGIGANATVSEIGLTGYLASIPLLQSAIGVLMALAVLARVISYLPPPQDNKRKIPKETVPSTPKHPSGGSEVSSP